MELLEYGLTKKDVKIISEQLLEFTNNLIQDVPKILSLVDKSLKTLEIKREKVEISGSNYAQKLTYTDRLLKKLN